MIDNIPMELRELRQWVCAGDDKVPINPLTGQAADVTNETTWGSFSEAKRAGFKHVGFVLTVNDPYSIIDLDDPEKLRKKSEECYEQGVQANSKILQMFDSYAELSQSGKGAHIVVKGKIPFGVRRDSVEVYSNARYMICTGNVIKQMPILDHQTLLNTLYFEMSQVNRGVELVEKEHTYEDLEIFEMACQASNSEKFNSLCSGDISEYPSQSEADLALLSIFAYYSQSNAQVRRMFRMSALGKREKAVKNDKYLDFALEKIRSQQPPEVNMEEIKANAEVVIQKAIAKETGGVKVPGKAKKKHDLEMPPGIIGEMAEYFYATAIRPVREIALCAALSLTAGVVGRSYNISGSGLNQYIILLARTGSGKEGAAMGIENLIAAVRPVIPVIDQYLGPAAFASGQALVKVLNEQPCFLSILGEFGLTLQQLSDHKANSAQIMLRKVLLDLYAKSGWNRNLRSSVYSDTEKNTKIIQAPNVTIFGESTQETFFDGLDASHIAEGLIPRFSVIEYTGDRPPRNQNANCPPSPELQQRFADLATVAITTTNNNTCAPVQMDRGGGDLLDKFDADADAKMNASKAEVEIQVWNRAHLKALKLSALVAVGVNPHRPVITQEIAQWSIDFVTRDITLVATRFKDGDVGTGDSKQMNDVKRLIERLMTHPPKEMNAEMIKDRVIPYKYLIQRTANLSSFTHDKMGATNALKKVIQSMIDAGMLLKMREIEIRRNYKYSGLAYAMSGEW